MVLHLQSSGLDAFTRRDSLTASPVHPDLFTVAGRCNDGRKVTSKANIFSGEEEGGVTVRGLSIRSQMILQLTRPFPFPPERLSQSVRGLTQPPVIQLNPTKRMQITHSIM